MIRFDKRFDPPALTVAVMLTGVVHARPKVECQAIIDTGADISAVPSALSEKLRLYRFAQIQLEDARGVQEPVYTYEAKIALEKQVALTMEVILTPFSFAILGRDWLQNYSILVNGPEQEFFISDSLQEIITSLEQR